MPPTLLLDPSRLRLDLLRVNGSTIAVVTATTSATSPCPLCHHPSSRVHSRYVRTLADLPWHGVAVSVQLTVRRFFCEAAACPRRIFAERLPGIVAPYARRTARLTEALELIGLALGGEAGARVLAGLQMGTSPDTVLRVIRAGIDRTITTPRVLGIDDFAFRRGHRYGSILVDLERRRVVDLLPDRKPETVIAWLEQHGRPEIISRDRGGGYAEAARRGAPNAIQVADRFHLTKNLVESLETFFLRKRSLLQETFSTLTEARAPPEEDLPRDAMYQGKRNSPQNWQRRAEEAGEARHAARLAAYEAIRALQEKGADIAHIARTVGVSRRTVYRYTRMEGPPDRARPGPRPGNRVLAPYEPYLVQRWKEGCHNGVKLWHEIQEQGFAYSVTNVSRFLAHLRREGRPPHPVGKTTGTAISSTQAPTARRVAFLTIACRTGLEEEDRAYLECLRAHDAVIEQVCQAAQDFMQMLRGREGERLDAWIERARESEIDELRRFAVGLQSDHAAVQAGLTHRWSNGPVEGHVNRLKLLKRQMYGRANFDLLRQRVLRTA